VIYNDGLKFNCPISEEISSKTVSIPFHPNLSEIDMNLIINKIFDYGK